MSQTIETFTPEQEALLNEPNLADFVTLMPDGAPQSTPVWIDYDADAGHILVNTAEGRVKTRNVRRDPRVAVTVVHRDDNYRWVAVRGRAVEVTNEGAKEHIDKLAKKYLGKDEYPWHDPNNARVLIRIQPERIAG
jgi:PPOX class probable F420-dependent enzyme